MQSVDVLIRELAPREGCQILPRAVPISEKLTLIDLLIQSGVQEIEVTSFVRADLVPQLADAGELIEELSLRYLPPLPTLRALALNPKGYQRALTYSRLSHDPWFYSGASDTFLQRNMNTSWERQKESLHKEWAPIWRTQGVTEVSIMVSNAFGCAYEGIVTLEQLEQRCVAITKELRELGFATKELSLADTVGMGSPGAIEECVRRLDQLASTMSLHLHDTNGRGLECADAGLANGIRIFESSVGGLGGCPFTRGAAGNIATERLVQLVTQRGLTHGIDYSRLLQAAAFAQSLNSRYGSAAV